MVSGTAPICIPLDESSGSDNIATNGLLTAMLRSHSQVSDLIFSPGRGPQIQVNGELIAIEAPGLRPFTADDTRRMASDLTGNNKQAITMLREQGCCDVSYGLPGLARFRVNIFIQRGSCAVVMRVIPTAIPDLASLGLPASLKEVTSLHSGVVLVTGPRNSGKSSTLAALLDGINRERVCHIITVEDPIEFLHNHKRATVHQREVHSDTPSLSQGLRAALRQAPDVIMVSDLRDRETVDMVLDAAETGHVVLASLNAPDPAKTVLRIAGHFSAAEQAGIRSRLAKNLRCIISQRLLPKKDGSGRVLVAEVLTVDPQKRKWLEENDLRVADPSEAANRRKELDYFDAKITQLVRAGTVDSDAALMHATDPEQLRLALAEPR
jgi:twitching motility protein PilT